MARIEAAIKAGEEKGYSQDEVLRLMKELGMGNAETIKYFSGAGQLGVVQATGPTLLSVLDILRKKAVDPEDNEPQPQNPTTTLGVRSLLGRTHGKGGKHARSFRSRPVETLVIRREEENNRK